MNHNPLIRSELRDTALTVSALSAGFSPEHASTWYEYCKTLVENLRKNLASSGRSAEEIEEISYAQCALLDEVALQNLQGSDREVWEMNPMQVHFFQSYICAEASSGLGKPPLWFRDTYCSRFAR